MANDRNAIEELIEQVKRTPGFKVRDTPGGFQRIMAPEDKGGGVVLSPRAGQGSARTLANFRADLLRIGWNSDEIIAADAERAAEGMAAAREEEARALAAAERRVAAENEAAEKLAAEERARAEEAELERMIAEEEAAEAAAADAQRKAETKAVKAAAKERNFAEAESLLAKKKAADKAIRSAKKVAATPTAKEQFVPEIPPIPAAVTKAPGSPLNPFMPPAEITVPTGSLAAPPEMEVDEEWEPLPLSDEDVRLLLSLQPKIVYFTAEMAARALEAIQCRQRHFSQANADRWLVSMEEGDWELNPSDAIVFDDHYRDESWQVWFAGDAAPTTINRSCLINGQHRLWAVLALSEEAREQYYPNGVPFLMVHGFPSEKAHIFDTGKSRSGSDAITVDGMPGWGNLQVSALRLAMRFDASFRPKKDAKDKVNGVKNWGSWNGVKFSHKQLVVASRGEYKTVKDFYNVAHDLGRSKVNKSAGIAFGYLIARDNPQGGENKPNQLFIDGVAGKAPLGDRDPRMAMMRYAMLGAESGRGKWDAAATHLAHLLREYANWMIGKPVDLSQIEPTQPMPCVWQHGMDWYGSPKVLRFPLRAPRS